MDALASAVAVVSAPCTVWSEYIIAGNVSTHSSMIPLFRTSCRFRRVNAPA